MIRNLDDITYVHIGARVVQTGVANDVAYLQTSDFDDFGRLLLSAPHTQIDRNQDIPERAWIRPGDVLLTGKSNRNTAIYYREDYPAAVASAAFYILRVLDPTVILPEFLACFLNQSTTQAQIRSRISSTTTVPTLNKKDLLDLPIPILPVATQQYLIELYNAFLSVRELSLQLINHHENLVTQCFSMTISSQMHLSGN